MSAICNRCRRPLKSEKSIERGYGHTCYVREFGESPQETKGSIKRTRVRKMKGYFND